MRVINISHQDYANYSYYNAEAMKYVGVNADAYVLLPHQFGYKKQAIRTSLRDIHKQIQRADVIQVMHSCGTMLDIVKMYPNKKVIVWHTGTRYRKDYNKHNHRWRNIADKTIIALGEFESLAPNSEYFGITVNVNDYNPKYNAFNPIKIGHYPSNADVKGTKSILNVINKLKKAYPDKFHFKYSTLKVQHEQQQKRMDECDVYIEMCATEQGGNPYGSYGTTALEAAAMGKIVVTNNMWEDLYNRTYGDSALQIANGERALYEKLEDIIHWSHDEIISEKVRSRMWVVDKHSYEAQGNRMINILKSIK